MRSFGENILEETLVTALIPNKSIALTAVCINVDQRTLEGVSLWYNKGIPTYRIYDRTNGEIVSFCEQVQSKAPSSVVDDTMKEV